MEKLNHGKIEIPEVLFGSNSRLNDAIKKSSIFDSARPPEDISTLLISKKNSVQTIIIAVQIKEITKY